MNVARWKEGQIEKMEIKIECMECGEVFIVEEEDIYNIEYPNCGSSDLEIA
jgi:Zn finger protein HypA/HybF involved in hydrogenase expression